MSIEWLSISAAAKELGVSTRTIRRFIKSGKIKAKLFDGTYGPEYRIAELPAEIRKLQPPDSTPDTPSQLFTIIKELQDRNLALAAQLGAATERLRSLENQVKLLSAPKFPWWKRLFQIKRAQI